MSFSLGVVDWYICLIVLSFSIFLGLYLSIRKKSSADSARFFLADRSLSWPLVGASLFATNIGAEHLVGLSGDAYEKTQVMLGRFAIVIATLLGVMAAYAVYKTPDGLHKYLQTISIYLVMPVAPAIVFGILSKRVTAAGALTSVLVGIVFSVIFVTDQLIGVQAGEHLFPWLHTRLTLNYTYRGLWGTLACIATMFAVSSFTKKTDPAKLERLTVDWKGQKERFRGVFDWRLQLAVLSAITVLLYWLLW